MRGRKEIIMQEAKQKEVNGSEERGGRLTSHLKGRNDEGEKTSDINTEEPEEEDKKESKKIGD